MSHQSLECLDPNCLVGQCVGHLNICNHDEAHRHQSQEDETKTGTFEDGPRNLGVVRSDYSRCQSEINQIQNNRSRIDEYLTGESKIGIVSVFRPADPQTQSNDSY